MFGYLDERLHCGNPIFCLPHGTKVGRSTETFSPYLINTGYRASFLALAMHEQRYAYRYVEQAVEGLLFL